VQPIGFAKIFSLFLKMFEILCKQGGGKIRPVRYIGVLNAKEIDKE
jgi:hypothetical protein